MKDGRWNLWNSSVVKMSKKDPRWRLSKRRLIHISSKDACWSLSNSQEIMSMKDARWSLSKSPLIHLSRNDVCWRCSNNQTIQMSRKDVRWSLSNREATQMSRKDACWRLWYRCPFGLTENLSTSEVTFEDFLQSSETRRMCYPFWDLWIPTKNKDKFSERCYKSRSRHVCVCCVCVQASRANIISTENVSPLKDLI